MEPVIRQSAKVLLVDPSDRVLLLSAIDMKAADPVVFWFAVGGGVKEGESTEDAAIREVEEETGLLIDQVGPVVSRRRASFEFEGEAVEQDEEYFFARVAPFTPTTANMEEVELRTHVAFRWWSVAELRGTDEPVFPENLADLLEELLA
jgi:8-oxo-dGTP pyrophosphatase MutT (NUDIX family)